MTRLCFVVLMLLTSVTVFAMPARVRLRNVDTPEMNGDCEYERTHAVAARARLSEIIPTGSMVELSNVKDDKYVGRIDANVRSSSGADVGEILIRENFGRRYNGGRRRPWCGK